jgi:hypothetical protein
VRGTGFLKGEGTISVTKIKFKRRDDHAEMDACIFDLSILHRIYLQPSASLDREGTKMDLRHEPIRRRTGGRLGFNRGVRSEIADQSVA